MLFNFLFPIMILIAGEKTSPLPYNDCNTCISRNVNDNVEFSTPTDEKIIFNKIISKDTVYRVQIMIDCADYQADSAAYLELSNGRQIGRVRVPIGVKMTQNMKKPFTLVAAFDLGKQEIYYLNNFGIKSFAIGKQKCSVENKKQKTFIKYFKCLMSAG